MDHYVEVIVPLALDAAFTYRVPGHMAGQIAVGSRVVVPFGTRRFYTAIVTATSSAPPAGRDIRDIEQLLDPEPIVRRPQLQLWQWIADYYMCAVGEVYRAAVPSGLKIESETFVELSPDLDRERLGGLNDKELDIISSLEHSSKRLSVAQLSKLTGITDISRPLASLLEGGYVIVSERLVERYRTLRMQYVSVKGRPDVAGEMARLFSIVKGAPRQEAALMALIEMTSFGRMGQESPRGVPRKALEERASVAPQIITAMLKRDVIEIENREVSRFSYTGPTPDGTLPELSPAQTEALRQIGDSWIDHDVTLLHGVTSSGKTEIYIHLIDQTLSQRRQALMLVPEIALTTQLTTRLQRVFGDKVVIYHSKFSDNERVEIWRRVLSTNEPVVVIGARSAVFLPFGQLGLVIVDEEHEPSYKQNDPAPRYNARDTATMLARMHGAKTLLASATPAIDTYYKANTGRFGLVTLSERYGGLQMPQVELVDMQAERQRGTLRGVFSSGLREAVSQTLGAGKQAILFLNRRGYAPVAECPHCAYVVKCADCDVTLTYHRGTDRLQCHYCGTEYAMPRTCPVCHEPGIRVHGYGTERLEEELADAFKGVSIVRMDLDTTRARDGYDRIIDDFSQGRAQLLVGTQMVTKGLDFANVLTVGVVNADSMINMPDFRAGERAFNMLEQVAGRAGRHGQQGRVIIQTRQPGHPLLQSVIDHDYADHYNREIDARHQFNYPPFARIVNIYIRHRDRQAVASLSVLYATRLRQLFGNRVNGPDEPDVSRVKTYYIRKIMLKFEPTVSMPKVRRLLRDLHAELYTGHVDAIRQAVIAYDVDPY